jgi:hypothetical protein
MGLQFMEMRYYISSTTQKRKNQHYERGEKHDVF